MSHLNKGEYHLVVQYPDSKVEIIELKQKWFYGKEDTPCDSVDIGALDLITTRFKTLEEMKTQMFNNGYIKSMDVDIYIVRRQKYNGKNMISEYSLIFDQSRRTEFIRTLAKKRLTTKIEFNDINNFLNEFITKVFYNELFYEYIMLPWTNIDKEFKEELIKMVQNKKQKEKEGIELKPLYALKYKNQKRLTSYTVTRNIVAAWNIFEIITKKYKKDDGTIDLEPKEIRIIVDEYLNTYKNRRIVKDKLKEKLDKNYIKGQMSLTDYIEEEQKKL